MELMEQTTGLRVHSHTMIQKLQGYVFGASCQVLLCMNPQVSQNPHTRHDAEPSVRATRDLMYVSRIRHHGSKRRSTLIFRNGLRSEASDELQGAARSGTLSGKRLKAGLSHNGFTAA